MYISNLLLGNLLPNQHILEEKRLLRFHQNGATSKLPGWMEKCCVYVYFFNYCDCSDLSPFIIASSQMPDKPSQNSITPLLKMIPGSRTNSSA